ncbi:MAG: radical SAM protein [Thaumarchaeota archaeon]|nr:radical SAM protein [Nitrososphaerota archaeon]
MKVILLYAPFCTPAMMPYSLSYLKNFLENNLNIETKCLDLNAKFHTLKFPKLYAELKAIKEMNQYNLPLFAKLLETLERQSREIYSENNWNVVESKAPEFLKELVEQITREKPDLVAFSLVYSSQCFYAKALLQALTEKGIPCIVGGPAANSKIKAICPYLKNEVELVEYIAKNFEKKSFTPMQKVISSKFLKYKEENYNCGTIPDFSDYVMENYFTLEKMIPLKTCSTCFYKQCTFCTHFADVPYLEYNIENIRKTIVQSKAKYVYFVDDMIAKNRLVELAEMLKPLNVKWWCQLRPTKDLIGVLKELQASGLHTVSWGVESGNQRILDVMKKGTQVEIAAQVLQESHAAGIKNAAYIMFGFPTETKEEFLDTINFLKQNENAVDLVTTSIFGLQKGGKVYANPEAFGVAQITETERTVLDTSITYTTSIGMQREDARDMRRRYIKTIKNIEKFPRVLNYFKEQVLLW